MKLNYFKTFDELDDYFKDTLIELGVSQRKLLTEVGKHFRKKIRAAHWIKWPWWLKSSDNSNSPLLKTGSLRNAVSYKTTTNSVEVYSKKEWLALIHEYWMTYKMTDKQRKWLFANVFKGKKTKGRPRNSWWSGMVTIPARPIWRRIIAQEEKNVEKIAGDIFDKIFK